LDLLPSDVMYGKMKHLEYVCMQIEKEIFYLKQQ